MRTRLGTLLLIASLALAACRGGGTSLPATPSNPASFGEGGTAMVTPFSTTGVRVASLCGRPAPGHRQCFALARTDIGPTNVSGVRAMAVNNFGYGPSQLQAAYQINTSANPGATVAIVDAFDDPNAESDLAQYRSTFGLPACTTANFCFRKLDQNGGTSYPTFDSGWSGEISLDVDMVSAICPQCHILLVEANSASNSDLATAVNQAAKQPGVVAISNSYGGNESGSGANANYNHKGIVITASTGDSGYGAQDPAGYSTVVAVGGTRLQPWINVRGWTETAWSCSSSFSCSSSGTGGTGSGCSAITAKPAWQAAVSGVNGCTKRNIGDISAVADPASGVFVYNSYGASGAGFYIYGGTSASSPIVASMFAEAGNGPTITSGGSGGAAQYIWNHHAGHVFDVTSGTNEPSAAGSCLSAWNYICKARVGYDGLTGWGTPLGYGAL